MAAYTGHTAGIRERLGCQFCKAVSSRRYTVPMLESLRGVSSILAAHAERTLNIGGKMEQRQLGNLAIQYHCAFKVLVGASGSDS